MLAKLRPPASGMDFAINKLRVEASAPVAAGVCAGSAVVGPVARLMPASVLGGRILVSISLDWEAEPSRVVPASLPGDDDSLTRVAPSARQNFSASSISTRLHWGHRFIWSAAA